MGHPIQNRTAQPTFGFLVGQSARPQFVADDLLIAKPLRFSQRAAVIAPLLFPACAPLAADRPQNLIAGLRGGFTVAVLLNLGVFAQRNDRFDRPWVQRIGQRLEDLVFVVAAIAPQPGHLGVDLPQQRRDLRRIIDAIFRQGLGDDLAGGLVDPQV